jgi:protein-S-isoprenylcysteine O-methyltransferase Ste14
MTPVLNRFQDMHILSWIAIIMVYGFSEMGIGIYGRTLFRRKKVRDATFYGITVPAMAGMYGALFDAVLQNHHFPTALFASGLAVLAFGVILRITALLQIGRGFSTKVERSDNQQLQTSGIYGMVRHPLYCATLLQVLGTGLTLNSLVAFILLPVCLAGVLFRIRKEERFMTAEFPEYRGYMNKTRRLIPWIY